MSGSRIIKGILIAVVLIFIIAGSKGIEIYRKAFRTNVALDQSRFEYLYIKTGWNFDSVNTFLITHNWLKNPKSFEWVAEKKNYKSLVKPGRYKIKNRMSNNDLVNLLRSGNQEPIQLTFNNIRTLEQFAAAVSKQLEIDSSFVINYISDSLTHNKYGLNEATMACIFIPNTYEVFWNISAEKLTERMFNEYEKFWNTQRKNKAEKLGLTQFEIITLASIVNEETRKNDEKDEIAGVYINRLNSGMPLQADPTIIFALKDFTIKRVLNKDRRVDSPYNTYKHAGLPPGPICLPEISSIDAVLNFSKHKYYYFCAKSDFSGYHVFAKTLSEHSKNARAYQRELDKRRIYR